MSEQYRDHQAHARIDRIERLLEKYIQEQEELANSLKSIADNTKELVDIVKGVKGFRTLIVWVAPVVVAIGGVIAYFKGQ